MVSVLFREFVSCMQSQLNKVTPLPVDLHTGSYASTYIICKIFVYNMVLCRLSFDGVRRLCMLPTVLGNTSPAPACIYVAFLELGRERGLLVRTCYELRCPASYVLRS